MEIFLLWIGASIVVAIGASNRGRGGFGWFLLSMIFSPLLTLVALLLLPKIDPDAPVLADDPSDSEATHRRCPDCREIVRRDARKCKHCGSALEPEAAEAP